MPESRSIVHSILAKARIADIRHLPFPHLVIEDCLPADYYKALATQYPSNELVVDLAAGRRKGPVLQNQRNDICACEARRNAGLLSPLWLEFIRYHTSQEFLDEALKLFAPAIRTLYPRLEQRLGKPLEACRSGIRFDPDEDRGDISLDCQPGINTPVTQQGAVRRVHTDSPEELFAGLLYFRLQEDDSTGGDLEIHRWKSDSQRWFDGKEIADKDAQWLGTIPYRANTLVMFVNSEQSLHAVSARSVTPHTRRLVNFVGEVYRVVPEGLFVKRQRATVRLRNALRKKIEKMRRRSSSGG